MTDDVNRSMATTNAFFYGTLMHPQILRDVIRNDGLHLTFCPAVLLHFTRHKVKNADYPGVVPYSKANQALFGGKDLSLEDQSTRGTLVTGLTHLDMCYLDIFEGDEYIRTKVPVYPLEELTPLEGHEDDNQFTPAVPPPLPALSAFPTPIDADVYQYVNVRNLHPELWLFEVFVKENARKWIGRSDRDTYTGYEDGEVDAADPPAAIVEVASS